MGPSPPHSADYGGWAFAEHFGVPHYPKGGHDFPTYHVTMDRMVGEDEDSGNVFIEAQYLSHDLNYAWVYATGLPLSDRGYDLFFSRVALPSGWTSNAQEVISPSDLSLLDSDLSWTGIYRTTPEPPLRSALLALAALNESSEVVQQMASYHFAALETRDPSLYLLLFAQGLTIARELLPGPDDAAKDQALPAPVQTAKRRPLHWLLGAGNLRRQTRHAITRRPAMALHPEMDEEEREDFQHDADLLLRYAACKELGLPFVHQNDGTTTAAT